MDYLYSSFGIVITLASCVAAFGTNTRVRLLSTWIASLTLAFLFLALQSELLAFTLSLTSSVVTWVLITQTLVFGDFESTPSSPLGWRRQILPATAALMIVGIVYLATPSPLLEQLAMPEFTHIQLTELGSVALSRFFLFSVIVSAASAGAVVGIGMVARSEWRSDKGDL